MSGDERGGYTVILVPSDAEGTRSVRLTARALRIGTAVVAVGAVGLMVLLATWWYFAASAARVPELEAQVARLEADTARVAELAQSLSRIEGEYAKVRNMLGAGAVSQAELEGKRELLPAPEATSGEEKPAVTSGLSPEIPTSWPLVAAGFVTRLHGAPGPEGGHPGLDIAVAQDSYIRASGAGVVLEAGSDSIYGLYVLIQHGSSGYSSMYGHASRLFVAPGDTVRQNQVIALSGNTGRSTAPHLHFEILQNGRPIDPLRLVHQRSSS